MEYSLWSCQELYTYIYIYIPLIMENCTIISLESRKSEKTELFPATNPSILFYWNQQQVGHYVWSSRLHWRHGERKIKWQVGQYFVH